MDIQLESAEPHTIRSYTNTSITILDTTYTASVIICKQAIQTPWLIQTISDLSLDNLEPLLTYNPEIIILGHASTQRPSPLITAHLSTQRIGVESMSIGAACRTFNVLLSEHRAVVLGIILNQSSCL